MTSVRLSTFCAVLVLAGVSAPSGFAAGESDGPISLGICGDAFRSVEELADIEVFRTELAKNAALRSANAAASKAASDALIEAFDGVALGAEEKGMIQDAKILVENPIFDEAMARSFAVAGMKKGDSILEFQAKLKIASPEHQAAFSELVLKQYNDLIEQAFVWGDEEKFENIGKRWGMPTDQSFDVLTHWAAGEATDHGQIKIAALAWAKAIDPDQVVRDIRAMKSIPKEMRITDTETVLITRIRKPHYDQDLANNLGPISDSEFKWRLRLWNFLGWSKHKLNLIRYPKEASFVIALSVAPVTLIHAIGHDWNLTNTVATIIGGVATCPPLVMQMTKRAALKNHESIFLEILTVKQLSELSRWISAYPNRAMEIGFGELGPPLETRISALRNLRYKVR